MQTLLASALAHCIWAEAAFATTDDCTGWSSATHPALMSLNDCDQDPVIRRVGKLCIRHEWRCLQESFSDWVARWFAELQEPVRLEIKEDLLIFSGESATEAWAIFWQSVPSTESESRILLSRIRPALHEGSMP